MLRFSILINFPVKSRSLLKIAFNTFILSLILINFDSITNPVTSRSPSADDDGSGTICNMEAFRIIVQNYVKLARAIEFQFYAAEEPGLLGSQAIANACQK